MERAVAEAERIIDIYLVIVDKMDLSGLAHSTAIECAIVHVNGLIEEHLVYYAKREVAITHWKKVKEVLESK